MEINAIVAIDKIGCIGYNNELVFKSKKDLKFFKKLTTDQIVVMGSQTYRSIGSKPLPNRINVIISRKENFDDVFVYSNINKMLEDLIASFSDKQIWVIGGTQIYRLFMELNLLDSIYITKFDKTSEFCDTFFPMELMGKYQLISLENEIDGDIDMQFLKYIRKPLWLY